MIEPVRSIASETNEMKTLTSPRQPNAEEANSIRQERVPKDVRIGIDPLVATIGIVRLASQCEARAGE